MRIGTAETLHEMNGHGRLEGFDFSDLEPARCTDYGNARRFVHDHRDTARYIPHDRKWLVWDGKRWERDETGAVVRLAKATVQGMYAEVAGLDDPDERKQLSKHATQSESERAIKAMIALAATEREMVVTPDQLDADPWVLNVANGLLDLRTAALRTHDPAALCTMLAPVNFDPEATCPQWLAFLRRIFDGDAELLAYMNRALGYCLSGLTTEQAFFLPYGGGANGKSTLLSIQQDLLGDYARSTRAETLMVKRDGAIPNDIAALKGARMVVASESEAGHRLAEGIVKQFTGGDLITARFMRAEYFSYRPTFKIFLATNHRPTIRGTDHAIWRRIHLIPFNVTIPEAEQDRQLGDKLRTELPGILTWAVGGCLAWQAQGLQPPPAVRDATTDFRHQMDVLGGFVTDHVIEEPGESVTVAVLYERYEQWCQQNGEKPLSKRMFGTRFEERGIAQRGRLNDARTWTGIRLRSPLENAS